MSEPTLGSSPSDRLITETRRHRQGPVDLGRVAVVTSADGDVLGALGTGMGIIFAFFCWNSSLMMHANTPIACRTLYSCVYLLIQCHGQNNCHNTIVQCGTV